MMKNDCLFCARIHRVGRTFFFLWLRLILGHLQPRYSEDANKFSWRDIVSDRIQRFPRPFILGRVVLDLFWFFAESAVKTVHCIACRFVFHRRFSAQPRLERLQFFGRHFVPGPVGGLRADAVETPLSLVRRIVVTVDVQSLVQ